MAKSMTSGINPSGSFAANAALGMQVQVALARRAQDVTKQQGQAAVAMLQAAVQLQEQFVSSGPVGQHLDVRG